MSNGIRLSVGGWCAQAIDLLEGSIVSRSWVEHDHDLDNLRDDPRFQRYLESLSGID